MAAVPFKTCIRIHNSKIERGENGEKRYQRPRGDCPNEHWTAMIYYGLYDKYAGIQIHHGPDGPNLCIAPSFWQEAEHAFEHIMGIVQSEGLEISNDKDHCRSCHGHQKCVVLERRKTNQPIGELR